ncbi:unannotated protein [freshwater metagenome]|uniref:Unannotated protein n=1 Tax=freshwater metagenome TaxID=449393 RepID=A0A6J5ZZV9_9ZZZZ
MQHSFDAFAVDVGPEPFEILRTGRIAARQLRFVADFALAFSDCLQIFALRFGDNREVTDLVEAEAFRVAFKDSHRFSDYFRHRFGAVVVANDAAGDSGCPGANQRTLEHNHVRLIAAGSQFLREVPSRRETVNATADHDQARRGRQVFRRHRLILDLCPACTAKRFCGLMV